MSPGSWLQAAGALTAAGGVGFAAPIPWVIVRLHGTGALPTFFGWFPMYGGPLSARVSAPVFSAALASFGAVCLLDVYAGARLWAGDRAGATLTLALLPLEALYWAAFALPIPPALAVVRVALLAAGWAALRP